MHDLTVHVDGLSGDLQAAHGANVCREGGGERLNDLYERGRMERVDTCYNQGIR